MRSYLKQQIGRKMKTLFDEANKILKQFDNATLSADLNKLKELVANVESDVEKHNSFYRAAMYNSIATATSEIYKLEKKDGAVSKKDFLQKDLYYYRKAIDLFSSEEFINVANKGEVISLKASVYTNYGNALRDCGRKISAIEQYYKALEVYPPFAMAYGNLGLAYMHYAMFLPQNKGYIRDCLNNFAYKYLNYSINSKDPNIHDEAKVYYVGQLALFDADYREYLKKDIQLPKKQHFSQTEKDYREWCLRNCLFLSPLNDLPINDLSIAVDELSLPSIITSVDSGIPAILGMFNQLKQEYISARFIYYDSLDYNSKPHFSDKKTSLAETMDYAQFSLRIEKLKSVFKTLFGILDKIAFFLNEYYQLGIQYRDVSFSSVWQSKKFGKNGYDYQNILDINGNFALSSLYWIQREFEKSDDKYASNEFIRLKEIRNSLEHRYTVITMATENICEVERKDIATYISETELYDLTFLLLQIVREAIICIALCINVEEGKRFDKYDPEKLLTIEINEIDDEFKF